MWIWIIGIAIVIIVVNVLVISAFIKASWISSFQKQYTKNGKM